MVVKMVVNFFTMGTIYRKRGFYYVGFKDQYGEWQYESTKSKHKVDAQRLLRDREGAVDKKTLAGQFTFDDASKAVIAEYKMLGRRSLDVFERRITKHLKPVFTGMELSDITTPLIRDFILARQRAKASNAEINRELDALSKMFKLAMQDAKLFVRPHIPKLKESRARQGFVTDDEYSAIADKLEEHMKGIWSFLYLTGWRIDEVLSLRWVHVGDDVIRFTGQTKGDEAARTIPLYPALKAVIDEQKRLIGELTTPWVFTFFERTPKGHLRKKRAGTQISYNGWRNAFLDAKAAAKVRADLIPHDCRRTAIDRYERLGIAKSTAMAMVGHKTESVYKRYAITSPKTLEAAGAVLEGVTLPTDA